MAALLQDKFNIKIRCFKRTPELTPPSPHRERLSPELEVSGTATREPCHPDDQPEAGRGRSRTSIKRFTLVKQAKKAGKTTCSGIETALRTLERFAEDFPPLKSVLRDLVAVCDHVKVSLGPYFSLCLPTETEDFKRSSLCRENYKKLEVELSEMEATLKQFVELEFDPDERNSRFSQILSSIQEEAYRLKEKPLRCKMFQALESSKDEARVDECHRKIGSWIRQLQVQTSFVTLRNSDIQLRTSLLRQLSPVRYARYDSSHSAAIRRESFVYQPHVIKRDLRDWARTDDSPKVCWMVGTADASMTAVAYNLCEWLVKDSEAHLGASFFCSMESPWSDSNRILPTIAYQLAQRSSKFQSYLCKVLEKDPDISVLNLERQLNTLILNEFLHKPGSIDKGTVIVIDALDECKDSALMAEVLLQHASELPFKLFVTSRREPPIEQCDTEPHILRLSSCPSDDVEAHTTDAFSNLPWSSSDSERSVLQLNGLETMPGSITTPESIMLPDSIKVEMPPLYTMGPLEGPRTTWVQSGGLGVLSNMSTAWPQVDVCASSQVIATTPTDLLALLGDQPALKRVSLIQRGKAYSNVLSGERVPAIHVAQALLMRPDISGYTSEAQQSWTLGVTSKLLTPFMKAHETILALMKNLKVPTCSKGAHRGLLGSKPRCFLTPNMHGLRPPPEIIHIHTDVPSRAQKTTSTQETKSPNRQRTLSSPLYHVHRSTISATTSNHWFCQAESSVSELLETMRVCDVPISSYTITPPPVMEELLKHPRHIIYIWGVIYSPGNPKQTTLSKVTIDISLDERTLCSTIAMSCTTKRLPRLICYDSRNMKDRASLLTDECLLNRSELLISGLGELSELEKATEYDSHTLALTPDGPDLPPQHASLGLPYNDRYQRLGELADLEKAIECDSCTLLLIPDGRPDMLRLHASLGLPYDDRYQCLPVGGFADLEKSIDCRSPALELTPDGHPNMSQRHASPGVPYTGRFGYPGVLADLEKAIECDSRALVLTPNGHLDMLRLHASLGLLYDDRYQRLGELADLEKVIECDSRALALAPDDHPDVSPVC